MLRLCSIAAVAVGFLAPAPRAAAEVITLKMETNGTGVPYQPYGGPTQIGGSGPFQWTQQAPTSDTFPAAVQTYCIDLDQYIYLSQNHTFTVQPNLALAPTIGTPEKAAVITELFDRYYLDGLASTANQNAFQLALWNLVYDDDRSLSEGRIQAANAEAQALLTSLGTPYSNHDLAGSKLLALVSDTHQDQLVVIPDPGAPPAHAPAPPAAVLAGIALFALAGRARWSRRASPV